jgi:hypothetical protein
MIRSIDGQNIINDCATKPWTPTEGLLRQAGSPAPLHAAVALLS